MAHCGHFRSSGSTRREMLQRCSMGFGGVALASLLRQPAYGADETAPLVPKVQHYPAHARSVIFLYMDGGVSHVDSFDPKPRLDAEDGQPFKMEIQPTQFNDNGNTLASPWAFRRYGQSGIPISDLFPHIAQHADDLCVIRSAVADFPEHTNANYFLHTGIGIQGRPSMGAWAGYGLGSENQNLPGFVVLNGGLIPPGGLDNFGSGFLPASYQGSVFKAGEKAVANVRPREGTNQQQLRKLAMLKELDADVSLRFGGIDAMESAIANYELAYRMQIAVPELMDLSNEPQHLKRAYGMDAEWEPTKIYGRQCMIARRLVERGVRFIELTCPPVGGNDRWDQHSNLRKGHEENARSVDQPIGTLIADLKQRGLLEQTLLVFSGEFGRTPFAQGKDGRDHHPYAFSLWMCGGGIRGGTIYGATDEYGYYVTENKYSIHDMHATMLHCMGVDHEKLTYRFSGRDIRLTDVHGHVPREILS